MSFIFGEETPTPGSSPKSSHPFSMPGTALSLAVPAGTFGPATLSSAPSMPTSSNLGSAFRPFTPLRATNPLALATSFGSSAALGKQTSPWSQNPAKSVENQLAPVAEKLVTPALPKPGDALLGALQRAAEGRLTFFGGDALLREYAGEKDLATAAEQMRTISEQYPEALDLVRFLFKRGASVEGTRKTVDVAPARKAPGKQDLGDMREVLLPVVHDKLVPMGLEVKEPNHDGHLHDALARVVCHIVVLCAKKVGLKEALQEEKQLIMRSTGSVVPELTEWLWSEIEKRRVAPVQPKAEHDLPKAPQGKITDMFLPYAHTEEMYEKMLKDKKYEDPGYFGNQLVDEAETRCCAKPFSQQHSRLPTLNDDELTHLNTLIATKLCGSHRLPTYDEDAQASRLIDVFKAHGGKDKLAAKKACIQASRAHLDSRSEIFINELFDVVMTRSLLPVNTLEAGRDTLTFRLLDLPPELRTSIYRDLLVPGTIELTSCRHHQALSVKTGVTLGLLSTCRQISDEAKNIIFENNFLIDAHKCFSPLWMFPLKTLPHHLLPSLASVTMVLAVQMVVGDWKQLQAMTGLKHLKVCWLETERITPAHRKTVVADLMRNAQKDCEITFGPDNDAEKEHMEKRLEGLNVKQDWVVWHIQDAAVLVQVMEQVEQSGAPPSQVGAHAEQGVVKGCTSGKSGLYYFYCSGKVVCI